MFEQKRFQIRGKSSVWAGAVVVALLISLLPLSTAAAATWSPPFVLGANGSGLGGYPVFAQTGPSSGVVAYSDHDSEAGFSRVYVRRTVDGAVTWSSPERISGIYEGGYPQIASDGLAVYVVWLENGIKFRRSFDGGVTWRATKGFAPYYSGIWPGIATYGGKVALSWLDWQTNQVFVRVSKDRGRTFSPANKIGYSTSWSRSAVGYGDGILYVTWWAGDYSTQLKLRRSTNNATNWKPTVKMSPGRGSQQMAIVTAGTTAVLAYGSSYGVRTRATFNSGVTWSNALYHSSDDWNGGVALAYSSGQFHMAYPDRGSGAPELYYRSSGDGVTWGPASKIAEGYRQVGGVGYLDGHPLVFYTGTEAQNYRALVRRGP